MRATPHPGDPAAGLPDIDFSSIGPQVGEPFPEVVLPDQSGTLVDLHQSRAERTAVVVFHRSADW